MTPPMALLAGTSLGPYTIVAPLGAGGMGEVYRAHDTRLERDVAIKVLPSDVAQDALRLERFAREARAAAALNHPNILAVHDVSVAGGVHYLVSELLEGQTLAERLHDAQGGLAARKAIDYAQQIAQGLGAAHARGIVHRDLKPANVFVCADGRVKILDFGLARQAVAPGPAGLTTTGGSAPRTDPGQVLGTVGYMAPEQVRGQDVDARTDIFAFGAVLYEMLSGRRAFQADTSADTISAILSADPPDLVSSPDHLIPPALQRIVVRCLEKDAAARFQSAADLAFALQALTADSAAAVGVPAQPVPDPAQRAPTSRIRELVLLAAALAGLGAAAWSWQSRPQPTAVAGPVGQFDVAVHPEALQAAIRILVSPDGRWLLLLGRRQQWLHSAVNADTRLLGTEPSLGNSGCWAPDSSAIAFYNGEAVVVTRVDNTPSLVLGRTGSLSPPVTCAWSESGTVVLADGIGRLLVLDASGRDAAPRLLIDTGDGVARRVAGFLPASDTMVLTVDSGSPEHVGVFVGTVDGASTFVQVDDGRWDAGVVVDGNSVLLKRGSGLYELRLSDDGTRAVSPPRALTNDLPLNGPGMWSASANGVLAYGNTLPTRFTWFDRGGRSLGSVGPPSTWGAFAMSASGTRVVAARSGGTVQHLWTLDLARAIDEQLTFSDVRDSDPVLSADGRVAHVRGTGFNNSIRAVEWRAGQPEVELFSDPAGIGLDDRSADGRWALYHQRPGLAGADPSNLLVRDLQSPGTEARQLARCERGNVDESRFAPSGQWVAFNCNESGRNEVYLVPFPDAGSRVRVSVDGGVQPAWRQDGRELYFLGLDGSMMAAGVGAGEGPIVDRPRVLFQTPLRPNPQSEQYRVTADGQRFLLQVPEAGTPPLRVIVNWRERFGTNQSPRER